MGYSDFLALMKSHEAFDKTEFGKLLGARVRLLREKKGISLRAFETYEGSLDLQTLAKIEKGLKIPTAFTLYRIVTVIGSTLKIFLRISSELFLSI
jgi:transcriptional regulator with XRE-family HTH domain